MDSETRSITVTGLHAICKWFVRGFQLHLIRIRINKTILFLEYWDGGFYWCLRNLLTVRSWLLAKFNTRLAAYGESFNKQFAWYALRWRILLVSPQTLFCKRILLDALFCLDIVECSSLIDAHLIVRRGLSNGWRGRHNTMKFYLQIGSARLRCPQLVIISTIKCTQ